VPYYRRHSKVCFRYPFTPKTVPIFYTYTRTSFVNMRGVTGNSSQPTCVVLVTGCSNGGIGSALARSFSLRPGLHVYASTRDISKMSDLRALNNITLVSLDVTSTGSIQAAVEAIKGATGSKLDVLVNNAGCGYTMPYLDTDVKTAKNLFDVNVWGPMMVHAGISAHAGRGQGNSRHSWEYRGIAWPCIPRLVISYTTLRFAMSAC
jgi:hypothetical protein